MNDFKERKKVLGFWDLILFSFCAIFGVEAIATSAAIGPSAISWWLICIVGYFLPFGLIAAELGATYPEQGGIYIWIKKGLGNRWAARSIWYYWVALPLWVPAIYIAIAEIIGQMFFPNISLWMQILIAIVMIWVAVGINLCSLKISKWIPNFGTFSRLIVIIGMLTAAVVYFFKHGRFANEINFTNIMPNLNAAIVFIPIIIYNLEGCELISAASGEMKNPARDIPRAVILSALAIASLYLVTTFAIWVVIPIAEINVASGILHMFTITFSGHWVQQVITVVLGLLISFTLFAEIVTWNLGENRTVAEAANNGDLPKVLGKMTKNMAPIGASIVSGVISTVVIIIYGFIAKNAGELFWHVVSFSLVIGLFSYAMLFPSFIISRIKDKEIERPYRIPGPNWMAVMLAVVAEVFILTALLILFIQPGHDFVKSSLPVIIGVLLIVLVGEFLLRRKN
ncbi:MAG: APC family permease [Candidatus Omnitrophota bacterium]